MGEEEERGLEPILRAVETNDLSSPGRRRLFAPGNIHLLPPSCRDCSLFDIAGVVHFCKCSFCIQDISLISLIHNIFFMALFLFSYFSFGYINFFSLDYRLI